MTTQEIESLVQELINARSQQAEAEFARERSGFIVAKVANTCPILTPDQLDTFAHLIDRSVELVGGVIDE